MTLKELQQISNECKADAAFLAHPEVRQVWWSIVESDRKHTHDWVYCTSDGMKSGIPDLCHKCRTPYSEKIRNSRCESPDEIVVHQLHESCLSEATEVLRVKLAEAWEPVPRVQRRWAFDAAIGGVTADNYVLDSVRTRFIVFVATLGGVEVS